MSACSGTRPQITQCSFFKCPPISARSLALFGCTVSHCHGAAPVWSRAREMHQSNGTSCDGAIAHPYVLIMQVLQSCFYHDKAYDLCTSTGQPVTHNVRQGRPSCHGSAWASRFVLDVSSLLHYQVSRRRHCCISHCPRWIDDESSHNRRLAFSRLTG